MLFTKHTVASYLRELEISRLLQTKRSQSLNKIKLCKLSLQRIEQT